ncbi:TetR/AcrR family transcriptional regulator [Nocardioides sp.]|uniref:TetR/AcrR family transcriptional regulator n=1 Tax=Nocardioides sp. TaxID=35761 RepID=UPI0039E5517E
MAHNTDPRARRTRAKLVAAYRELRSERPETAVSVTELVRRAGVARSAFYAHFTDTEDLAVEALTELFDAISSVDTFTRYGEAGSALSSSIASMREVITFVGSRREEYLALLSSGGRYATAVEDAFAAHVLATLRERETTEGDPEVTARFIATGSLGVIAWWLGAPAGRSAEELARDLTAIFPRDVVT